MKTKTTGIPTCTDSGKDIDVSLNEVHQSNILCGACGSRFPLANNKMIGARHVAKLPTHKIPEELHELRKKMDAAEHTSRRSADHVSHETNLSTLP